MITSHVAILVKTGFRQFAVSMLPPTLLRRNPTSWSTPSVSQKAMKLSYLTIKALESSMVGTGTKGVQIWSLGTENLTSCIPFDLGSKHRSNHVHLSPRFVALRSRASFLLQLIVSFCCCSSCLSAPSPRSEVRLCDCGGGYRWSSAGKSTH